LTCSMCSNSIHRAVKTLDFVLSVTADIKTYTFEIHFKPDAAVDFDLIRRKVENAGFSVSSFIANIDFDHTRLHKNQPVVVAGKTFLFGPVQDQVLDGPQQIKILNKGFVPPKEHKGDIPISTPHTYNVSKL
jgi:copper chaperone CopZ